MVPPTAGSTHRKAIVSWSSEINKAIQTALINPTRLWERGKKTLSAVGNRYKIHGNSINSQTIKRYFYVLKTSLEHKHLSHG